MIKLNPKVVKDIFSGPTVTIEKKTLVPGVPRDKIVSLTKGS